MYGNYYGYQGFTIQPQQIIHVNGRAGAEAFQMAENSNILLLDDTEPIVWLAQTDGARYKTLTPYRITPIEPEKPVDMKSLEERIKVLEEAIKNESDESKTSEQN